MPLTFGGGINSIKDISELLRAGADKVCINTAACENYDFIYKACKTFGNQAIVGSVDYKTEKNKNIIYSNSGTKKTNLVFKKHLLELQKIGVGEIIITSIDKDGTMNGYDINTLKIATTALKIPVIASGGAGSFENMFNTIEKTNVSALAAASIYHFTKHTPLDVKKYLNKKSTCENLKMKNKTLNNLVFKKPFIIAEVSGNHGGSLNKMLKIIEEISKTGADAIKLQTFKPETITLDSYSKEFLINDKNSKWHKLRLFDLYKKSQTPWEWHKKIFKKANKLGLYAFSAPFDFSAVDFLEKLEVPIYKIASFENNHLPLIRYVALKKKPMIVSTGMASFNEISEIVKTVTKNGCKNLTLLKCTSTYPASIEESNILTIPEIKKNLNVM